MILCDVNVLVYAFRGDLPEHGRYRDWLTEAITGESPFGHSDLVASGFLRIVTHPRGFLEPSATLEAIRFVDAMRSRPNAVHVRPGAQHWPIFRRLCEGTAARGNLVADAFLAALAIESGSEWITADRDFARFPGLSWRHPLDG